MGKKNKNRGGDGGGGGGGGRGGWDGGDRGSWDGGRGGGGREGRGGGGGGRGGRGRHRNDDRGGNNNFNNNDNGKGGNNNYNDRGGRNPPRNHSRDQNRSHHPSKSQTPLYCSRCESPGHTASTCMSRPVPEESTCPCGNIYHYPSHCPYDNDPLVREDTVNARTGMFCTWCKDSGDGTHTFATCTRAVSFARDLRRIQRHEYTGLGFCWHCRETSHLSHVCVSNQAEMDRARWAAHISDVMEAWKGVRNTWFRDAYVENEVDTIMAGDVFSERRAPPEAASYQWCAMCEEFGHRTGSREGGCSTEMYDSRRPVEVASISRVKPFVPVGFRTKGVVKMNKMLQCQGMGCKALLGPWTFPRPRMGQYFMCSSCGMQNEHPDFQRRGTVRFNNHENEGRTGTIGEGKRGNAVVTPRKKIPPYVLALYDKRPSLKLQLTLARGQKVSNASPSSTSFPDGALYDIFSPVFYHGGEYWTHRGNFQEYWPAITFLITPKMAADASNDYLAINLGGRLGLSPECIGCGDPIVILDDEQDVVMCGTAGENTIGEGQGVGYFFRRDRTYDLNVCDCPQAFLGYRGEIGWRNYQY